MTHDFNLDTLVVWEQKGMLHFSVYRNNGREFRGNEEFLLSRVEGLMEQVHEWAALLNAVLSDEDVLSRDPDHKTPSQAVPPTPMTKHEKVANLKAKSTATTTMLGKIGKKIEDEDDEDDDTKDEATEEEEEAKEGDEEGG